jgi:hypothetical protein
MDTYYYIVTGPQCREAVFEIADDAPADAIAYDCAFRHLLANHDDRAEVRTPRCHGLHREHTAGRAINTAPIDVGNIFGMAEPILAGEHWSYGLNGDALAAFEPAALKYDPTGARSHARNKTMHALAAALLGLIRSLGHNDTHFTLSGAERQRRMCLVLRKPSGYPTAN